MDKSFKDYEEKISRMKGIIQELDMGSKDLSGALENFEEGVKLFKECNDILNKAEESVKIIKEINGKYIKENFGE